MDSTTYYVVSPNDWKNVGYLWILNRREEKSKTTSMNKTNSWQCGLVIDLLAYPSIDGSATKLRNTMYFTNNSWSSREVTADVSMLVLSVLSWNPENKEWTTQLIGWEEPPESVYLVYSLVLAVYLPINLPSVALVLIPARKLFFFFFPSPFKKKKRAFGVFPG